MTDDAACGARLISCIGVQSDLALLPHFLRHYIGLGIAADRMHLVLQSPDADDPGLTAARAILAASGITPHEVWVAPYTSDTMWEKRRAVQTRVARDGDWIVSADVDEFHAYPEPLQAFLNRCDAMGVTCTQGVFIDRLAPDGRLVPVAQAPEIAAQFPVMADVIASIGGTGRHFDRYGTVKLMAMRGHVLPSRGGHHPLRGQSGVVHLFGRPLAEFTGIDAPGFRFRVPLRVHHYHWTASLTGSLERRLSTAGVSPAGQEYGQKMLSHFRDHGGIDLGRAATTTAGIRGWRVRLAGMRMQARLRLIARRGRDRLRRAMS